MLVGACWWWLVVVVVTELRSLLDRTQRPGRRIAVPWQGLTPAPQADTNTHSELRRETHNLGWWNAEIF